MQIGPRCPLARVGLLSALSICLAGILPARAQTVAHDDASSTSYDSGWTNGQASGTGFSNWTLQLPSGASAGVASSSDNDFGEPGHANINTAGRALRLVSNNSSTAADGLRTFTNGAMQVGQVFTIWMDNGNLTTGGAVGFGLQNNANANNRFELYFQGGQSNYFINDSSSSTRNSGVGFTRGGLRVALLLIGTDSYRMNIVRDGAATATFVSTSGLTGTAGSGIDKFRVFNFNAGGNSFDDAFFTNQFDVSDGFVWDGGGSVDNITRPENWKLDVPPTSAEQLTMYFAGTTRLTPVVTGLLSVKTINFDATAGAFSLIPSGAALLTFFDGGIVNNSSNVQTLNVHSLINPIAGNTTFDTGNLPGGGLQTGSTGTLDITLPTRRLNWTGDNAGTIGAVITGSGTVNKTGSGLLHLSSGITHIFSGNTVVTGGTLRVDATLASPGGPVSIGNGSANSGILAGSGIISRAVNINSGGTVSPGSGNAGSADTIGNLTLNSGDLTLAGGGAYVVQLHRRADQGSEGVNWDKLSLSSLTVNATSGNRFVVRAVSLNNSFQPGALQNWDPDLQQTWRVATVSGTVTGFDIDDFEIDLTQFTNVNTIKSVFYFWRSGSDINLTYVPEPSSFLLVVLGAAGLLRRGGRRSSRF